MPQLRPTFSESWYRVADLRVKLRVSAQISRQFYRGERWYVVRDPAGNQFHRLSSPAYGFVGLLDGTRTVAEAWELVGGQLADSAPTQNEVIQILSQLHSANLIESNVTPDAAVLLRRHKKMVQRQWQGRLMNILFPRIPLWDPDTFLKRWMPVVGPFVSWAGAILWLAVVGAAIFSLAPSWSKLRTAGVDSIDPSNWPFLWATFVLIKAIHELGHAFACRRFGGECHELGIMFLVLIPAPYVDASTAWGFPNRWQRIFVGAAGMVIELFVAAILAFIWLGTRDGSLVHQLAFNAMLIASVSTLVFNANPLLRYDGYYILSDWLEIPNLRYRSTEYAMGLIKRHIFKVKLSQPLPPVKQRVELLLYAIASSIYRTFVGLMIIMLVWTTVPILGALMAIGGVVTWLVVPVVKVSKYLLIEPELHRKRVRATLWVGGAVAAAVIVVGFINVPMVYIAQGVVHPADKTTVFTAGPGVMRDIKVEDGQLVKKDDVIAVCEDEELATEIAILEHRREGLTALFNKGVVGDQNERKEYFKQIQTVNYQLDKGMKKQARLTIRAPMDGRLVAPDLRHMRGRYLREGEEIATIARDGNLRVTVLLDQTDATFPYHERSDKEIQLRLASTRSKTLVGTLDTTTEGRKRQATPVWALTHETASLGFAAGGSLQTDPSDAQGMKLMHPHIELWVDVANPDETIVPGQRATLRFEGERRPLIWNWTRRIWQLIQVRGQSKWI